MQEPKTAVHCTRFLLSLPSSNMNTVSEKMQRKKQHTHICLALKSSSVKDAVKCRCRLQIIFSLTNCPLTRTRGNGQKLKQRKLHLNTRRVDRDPTFLLFFFSPFFLFKVKVVKHWNTLPRELHLCTYSKAAWPQSWATCSRWPCLSRQLA